MRIAFGDGKQIIWSKQAHEIYRGNPNVAPPGQQRAPNLEWVKHYSNHRPYGHFTGGRWHFKPYQCKPGEVFFTLEERLFAENFTRDFVVLEPRVKPRGACEGVNKQWPVERYQELADKLQHRYDMRCVQLVPTDTRPLLRGVDVVETPTFRHALSVLTRTSLYVGPEGGLHHGSAAAGGRAVVIWGGFNTPRSTGYDWHVNITADGEPCGRFAPCPHCRVAMKSISVEQVLEAAVKELNAVSQVQDDLCSRPEDRRPEHRESVL